MAEQCGMKQGGGTLLFRDVCVKINQKDILKNVFGSASGGELLAIMGPSGAGKSTLLNALAGRIRINSGIISLDGEPMTRQLRRRVSYVIQQDAFYPNLTLRETLKFTAHIRLPDSMHDETKDRKVQEIVNLLGLGKCLDTRVGDFYKAGLSGGERKRASVACEMLADQDFFLLDEPTSGLDATYAHRLMVGLASYARDSRKTVVAVIHQPSNNIFNLFTNVLLLFEGEVVCFGNQENILDFYAKLGLYCDSEDNPADFILGRLKNAINSLQFEDASAASRREFESSAELLNSKPPDRCAADKYPKWPTSFIKQYCVLTRRHFLRQKNTYLSSLNLITLTVAIVCGLEWFQTERTESTARDRIGILFVMLVQNGFISIFGSLDSVLDWEGIFIRERSAGIYRLSAYVLSIMTSEMPYTIVYCSLFTIIVYWMAGLMPAAPNFLLFWMVMLLASFLAQSIGIFASVLVTNNVLLFTTANTAMTYCVIAGLTSVMHELIGTNNAPLVSWIETVAYWPMGGFFNPHTQDWFSWSKYLSYLTYAYAGLANIEFHYGDDLRCSSPNTTLYPAYCNETGRTLPGKEFLKDLNLDFAPLSVLILVLISISVVLRLATYATLRFFRHPNSL